MVLFPAPVLPTTPIFDPAGIRKFKFFNAGSKKSPYRYEKSKAESSFSTFTFSLTLFDRWMIPSIRFLTDFRSNEILCLILTSSCFSQAIRGVLNSLKLILENFGAISYFKGKKISLFCLVTFQKIFQPFACSGANFVYSNIRSTEVSWFSALADLRIARFKDPSIVIAWKLI